jgi:hypothetical protein
MFYGIASKTGLTDQGLLSFGISFFGSPLGKIFLYKKGFDLSIVALNSLTEDLGNKIKNNIYSLLGGMYYLVKNQIFPANSPVIQSTLLNKINVETQTDILKVLDDGKKKDLSKFDENILEKTKKLLKDRGLYVTKDEVALSFTKS